MTIANESGAAGAGNRAISPGTGEPDAFPLNPALTSVPIHPALARRWSPYRFHESREVPAEDLRGILEAARWAPSSFNEQPWRFIVVRRADSRRKELDEALMEGNAYAKRASVLVVTVAKDTYTQNGKPNKMAFHDTGLATANLLAEATSRGLISHPMGGFHRDLVREAFSIPDDFSPVVMVALGYHDPEMEDEKLQAREGRERERRPLGESVFGGGFGTPLEL